MKRLKPTRPIRPFTIFPLVLIMLWLALDFFDLMQLSEGDQRILILFGFVILSLDSLHDKLDKVP